MSYLGDDHTCSLRAPGNLRRCQRKSAPKIGHPLSLPNAYALHRHSHHKEFEIFTAGMVPRFGTANLELQAGYVSFLKPGLLCLHWLSTAMEVTQQTFPATHRPGSPRPTNVVGSSINLRETFQVCFQFCRTPSTLLEPGRLRAVRVLL